MSEELSRRKLLKVAASASAGLVLASCAPAAKPAPAAVGKGATEPTDNAAVPSDARGVTLQYYIGFGAGGNPDQVNAVSTLFAQFCDSSKGVVKAVEPQVVAWADAPQKLQSMVAAGTPPDVITMGMSQWDFAAEGAFIDINPLAAAENLDLKQWDQAAIDGYTVPAKNNMLYGLPFGANDEFLVVNKTLFNKAGIDLPPIQWDDASWTIDSFLDKASKLTTGVGANKNWGVLGIGADWNLPWIYGGAWVDDNLEKILIDQPSSIEGFQLNYDLMYKYKVMPTAAQSQALNNGFLSGKVGMVLDGAWSIGAYLGIKDFEWDIYPVAIGPGTDLHKRAQPYYPDALVISSKNAVQESWDLIKFLLLNDENYKAFLKIMSEVPARKSFRDWFVQDFWKATDPTKNFDVVMEGFGYAQVQKLFFNINWSEANTTEAAALSSVWTGTDTVAAVVPPLSKRLQEIWTLGNEQMKK